MVAVVCKSGRQVLGHHQRGRACRGCPDAAPRAQALPASAPQEPPPSPPSLDGRRRRADRRRRCRRPVSDEARGRRPCAPPRCRRPPPPCSPSPSSSPVAPASRDALRCAAETCCERSFAMASCLRTRRCCFFLPPRHRRYGDGAARSRSSGASTIAAAGCEAGAARSLFSAGTSARSRPADASIVAATDREAGTARSRSSIDTSPSTGVGRALAASRALLRRAAVAEGAAPVSRVSAKNSALSARRLWMTSSSRSPAASRCIRWPHSREDCWTTCSPAAMEPATSRPLSTGERPTDSDATQLRRRCTASASVPPHARNRRTQSSWTKPMLTNRCTSAAGTSAGSRGARGGPCAAAEAAAGAGASARAGAAGTRPAAAAAAAAAGSGAALLSREARRASCKSSRSVAAASSADIDALNGACLFGSGDDCCATAAAVPHTPVYLAKLARQHCRAETTQSTRPLTAG